MDMIEEQASDLRYLTDVPSVRRDSVTVSPRHPGGTNSGHHMRSTYVDSPNTNPELEPRDSASNIVPAKRNAAAAAADDDEPTGKQQRSKRNRYISIACNECKRRKIKCNGETPCRRCGNLNLACLYAPNCCANNFRDSDEFKQMSTKLDQLQDQMHSLSQEMSDIRQETLRLAPINDRNLPRPGSVFSSPLSSGAPANRTELPPFRQTLSFRGPTTPTFSIEVAKNTLHNMGYSNVDGPPAPEEVTSLTQTTSPVATTLSQPRDPLWDFDKDEMIRLCQVHEEEVGIMYPVLNMRDVIQHVVELSAWMDTIKKAGQTPQNGEDEGLNDLKSLQLKVIMCCGLVLEEHGHSEKAERLFGTVQPMADRMLMDDASDVTKLPFLALVAGYRFLSNDEVLAWRVMGQVARLCLELGLHRREALAKIRDEQQRRNAVNTFWTAYVLDMRWSFGTGLPYVIHVDKIDPKLPYPDEYPFLVAMIAYSQQGAKIWKLVDFFEPTLMRDLKRDDFDALDQELMQWYDTVPEEIRISSLDRDLPTPSSASYNLQRLQIWTRLRLNQMRLWLHQPVLHSASSIQANMPLAQKAVDIAKETITFLSRLNNDTNLYRRIQVFYHQFLTSAIGVLFLASTHAPIHFSPQCRHEFYLALDLIKDMSAKSWVSQRLWRTVRGLKAYAPRLGLQEDDPASANGISSFSAGTPRSGHGAFGGRSHAASSASTPAPTQGVDDPNNGTKLQNEMSKIFEGYMGMKGTTTLSAGNTPYHGGDPRNDGEISYGEEGIYGQLRSMF